MYTNVFAEWVIVAVCPVTSKAENRIQKRYTPSLSNHLGIHASESIFFRRALLFDFSNLSLGAIPNLLSQLARLICTPSSRKRKFNLTKYRTFSNDPTKKIFGKQFEMGEISFGRKISVRKGRLSNSFPFRICFAKTRV